MNNFQARARRNYSEKVAMNEKALTDVQRSTALAWVAGQMVIKRLAGGAEPPSNGSRNRSAEESPPPYGISTPVAREVETILRPGNVEEVRMLQAVIASISAQIRQREERVLKVEGPHKLVPFGRCIAAGMPCEKIEERDLFVTVPLVKAKGSDFTLQVSGDSMIGKGIAHGDMGLASDRDPVDGEDVTAFCDRESTLKTFRRKGRDCWLEPANDKFPKKVRTREEFLTQGVIVGKL